MRIPTRFGTFVAWKAFVLAAVILTVPLEAASPNVAVAVQTATWPAQGSSSAGTGVFLLRQTDHCIAARLLLRTPTPHLVILTYSFDANLGIISTQLEDGGTGWLLHEERQIPLHFADTSEALDQDFFLAKVAEIMSANSPDFGVIRICSVLTTTLEMETTLRGPDDPDHILDQLDESGFSRKLSRQVPAEIRNLIRETRALTCDAAGNGPFCVFAELLEIADRALSRSRLPDSEPVLPIMKTQGLLETTSQSLTFTAGQRDLLELFPTFNADRPFAHTCAQTTD